MMLALGLAYGQVQTGSRAAKNALESARDGDAPAHGTTRRDRWLGVASFAAMLLDPLASRLDYDEIAVMTDEMLDATAAWLPQFSRA